MWSYGGETKIVCGVLVGKTEGKRKLGRPRCRWENNIKISLEDIGQRAWTGGMWSYERETKIVCGVLVGKTEGKRTLRRPRCRWENNKKN